MRKVNIELLKPGEQCQQMPLIQLAAVSPNSNLLSSLGRLFGKGSVVEQMSCSAWLVRKRTTGATAASVLLGTDIAGVCWMLILCRPQTRPLLAGMFQCLLNQFVLVFAGRLWLVSRRLDADASVESTSAYPDHPLVCLPPGWSKIPSPMSFFYDKLPITLTIVINFGCKIAAEEWSVLKWVI